MNRLGRTVGFTLIEMAIVIVVIGLLLSGGLLAVGPVLNSSKTAQTNQKLDKIEQALTVYVIRYGCLPCPANGALGTVVGQSIGDGGVYAAQCLANHGSATCAVPAAGNSVVPWGTLGLSQEDAMDGWGNLISYVTTSALALNDNNTGAPSMVRNVNIYSAGALEVRDANPAGTTAITTEAAYVLISHGPDGSGAVGPTGTVKATVAGNTVQIDNAAGLCTAATPCHQDSPYFETSPANADHFDDVVRWRTAPSIIQACGQNSCGNPSN
jgi:prepilin-type N-terminal cleavage/methylation domain-containing protein